MLRILMIAVVGLLCASCGGGVSSYEDVFEAQAEIMMEMVSVLEDVNDEASADKAAAKIEALGNRLAELAGQIKELPQPTMEEMQELRKKQGAQTQEFQENAAAQMMKLAEYQSLGEAWTRALSNMR